MVRALMSSGGDKMWLAIRKAYEHNQISIQQICRDYHVTPGQITYRRRCEGWKARPRGRRGNGAEDLGGLRKLAPQQGKDGVVRPPAMAPQAASTPGPASEAVKRSRAKTGDSLAFGDADQFNDAVERLMDRLFRVTEKELSIIEERMEMGEIRTPADSARDTSSIGSLIKNLEKLTEFNEQLRGGGKQAGTIAGITADEADKIRRDLARRIERLAKG